MNFKNNAAPLSFLAFRGPLALLSTLAPLAILAAFSSFATLSTGCGKPTPNISAGEVEAATQPCPNPLRAEWKDALARVSAPMVDGKPGMYRATSLDYYIDGEAIGQDVHSTQSLHGSVDHVPGKTLSQYSLGLTCQHGIRPEPSGTSFDLPVSINRKTGEAAIETEKFTLRYQSITDQTTSLRGFTDLTRFLDNTYDEGASKVIYLVAQGNTSGYDIFFMNISEPTLFKASVFRKIHYELTPEN